MSTRPTIELRRVSRCSGGSWDAAHVTADRMQGGRVLPQLSASSAPDTAPRNNEQAGLATDLHRSPPITLRQIRESQPRLLAWDPPVTDAFISLRSPMRSCCLLS